MGTSDKKVNLAKVDRHALTIEKHKAVLGVSNFSVTEMLAGRHNKIEDGRRNRMQESVKRWGEVSKIW